ncbi:MAG: TcpQ domain-containing protein [Rhodobacteraceae bacterium]|nr:TcpQ domain-containing protein [Paracoccaceae bacterium]
MIRCPDWQNPGLVLTIDPVLSSKGRPNNTQSDTHQSNPIKAAVPATQIETAAGNCVRHRIRTRDTLGKLARQYLGNAARHLEIIAANPKTAANPKQLRVGDVLRIGCEKPVTAVRPEITPKEETPGFWASLFGGNRKLETAGKAPNPAVEVVRPRPKTPVWRAAKGEYLIDVLERWGKSANYQVIVEDRGDWRFEVPFKSEGTLRLALREVIKGFGSGPQAPLLVVYANRVVRVGAAR